jgi:hypothetical protein
LPKAGQDVQAQQPLVLGHRGRLLVRPGMIGQVAVEQRGHGGRLPRLEPFAAGIAAEPDLGRPLGRDAPRRLDLHRRVVADLRLADRGRPPAPDPVAQMEGFPTARQDVEAEARDLAVMQGVARRGGFGFLDRLRLDPHRPAVRSLIHLPPIFHLSSTPRETMRGTAQPRSGLNGCFAMDLWI